MKFFEKILGPKSSREKTEGAEAGLDHIAPAFFSQERNDAIEASLRRLGVNIKNKIEPLP